MTSLFLLVARLCLKPFEPLLQFSNDDWMVLVGVSCIAIALFISHKVHMITGR